MFVPFDKLVLLSDGPEVLRVRVHIRNDVRASAQSQAAAA
jgi:hypothetical protein